MCVCVCVCGNLKTQSLFYGVIELMKLLFLKAFKQMFLKERIDRTAIIIFAKINHSGKTFSHHGSGADTSYSKIRNMYKNALASEYNILLLICSFTLGEESKCHVACDLLETTFATTTDHGDTREEATKDKKESSGATACVAFWADPTQ